jgi:STE24 endopeptidase
MRYGQGQDVAFSAALKRCATFCLVLVSMTILAPPAAAQTQPTMQIPPAAQASPSFDPTVATDAYLATVPPDKRARSDAYFEGGYWLQLWNFLYGTIILWGLLAFGWSAAMRDRAEEWTRKRPLQTLIYWVQFNVVLAVADVSVDRCTPTSTASTSTVSPRRRSGPWLWDQTKGFGLVLLFGGLLITRCTACCAASANRGGSGRPASSSRSTSSSPAIAPVFIAPLFNSLHTGHRTGRFAIRSSGWRGPNGIKADALYVVDQSRQTTRISANVSGFLGTERISLNDNLLKRGSIEEIEAVLGHEMGHYVLNHLLKNVLETSLVVAIGFALVGVAFEWFRRRHGEWRVGVGRRRCGPSTDRTALRRVFVRGHADQQLDRPRDRVRSGHVRSERRAPA